MEESTWERDDTMRATYPILFRDEGTWFSRLKFKWLVTCMIECTLHMHVSDYDCPEFRDEIPFKGGENVRPEKFQFMEKWQDRNFDYKIVISVKNPELIL